MTGIDTDIGHGDLPHNQVREKEMKLEVTRGIECGRRVSGAKVENGLWRNEMVELDVVQIGSN